MSYTGLNNLSLRKILKSICLAFCNLSLAPKVVKTPQGINSEKEYIATQAPKMSSLYDFWTMIWEQDCKRIVMLTQLEESGMSKLHNVVFHRVRNLRTNALQIGLLVLSVHNGLAICNLTLALREIFYT